MVLRHLLLNINFVKILFVFKYDFFCRGTLPGFLYYRDGSKKCFFKDFFMKNFYLDRIEISQDSRNYLFT